MASLSPRRARAADPVRLEVFHHLFAALCEEMGVALQRSALSPNIKERRDHSCALFGADGGGDGPRLVAQAAHVPVHLGSTPASVRAAAAALDLGPGDAAVLNDPYRGGTHLPDVTLVSPVFLEGAGRGPTFYCANRAHHADVGGAVPGSMGPVPDVHGEGIRIPPVRLVRGGEVDRDVLALLLANMRVPSEREGDLFAQWSANLLGARRLEELAAEHGAAELVRRAAELSDWTERLARAALAALPDGEVEHEDALEGDGAPVIRLRLEKRGERLTCDLRASDPAAPGVSTTRAVAVSAVFYVLRALLPEGTPTNDGVLRPVEVLTRPGTVVHATYPTAVAAGNVETSQRLVDVLLGALDRLQPGRFPAASSGTMSNLTIGGVRPEGPEGTGEDRERFAYYETIAGGAGAGPAGPGASAVHTHMTNTRNTPIEALERDLPVRVLAYRIRRASGGRGRHRGGDGIQRCLLFRAPARVTWVAERQSSGPWGLAGGGAGRPGAARLRRAGVGGGRGKRLGGRVEIEVGPGDVLELETPGGGGYGA